MKRAQLLIATLAVGVLVLLGVASSFAGANAWSTTSPVAAGVLWQLALDPTRPASVYAAGSSASGSAFTPRVLKSIDAGATWSEVTNGIVNVQVGVVAVDPTNGLNVYVGGYNPAARSLALYRSGDGGASWQLLGWNFPSDQLDRPVNRLAIDPSNGRTLYVGTSNGVMKSVDAGATWTMLSGLPPSGNRGLAIDRTNPAVVYAAGDGGVHKSTNGGATWAPIVSGLPGVASGSTTVVRAHDVVIDPSDPRTLYVVAVPASGGELVFRSSDAGATWISASSGLPSDVIRGLAIDPLAPRTLYAALNGGSGQNLVRTTDQGGTWSPYSLPNGGYGSSVVVDSLNPQTIHVGHNDAIWEFTSAPAQGSATASATGTTTPGTATPAGSATATPATTPAATGTPVGGPAPRDDRYFAATGFRVDNDAFWNYFNRRGGARMFGYPTSRTFSFLGFPSQFYQRAVMQLAPDGSVRLLNLLDPGLLPYTSFNGAQMPAPDPALVGAAPPPGSPNYASSVVDFVRANAPNTFDGQPTNFTANFDSTVTMATAYPQGGGDASLLPGINLELWGIPTSRPAYDPNNRNFIYQRFQRGIMHYDAGCQCTNGILLADYLKAIITGRNLPSDLQAQAANSLFMRQYNPSKDRWLERPDQMPGTDLTGAFEPQ